MNVKLVNCYQNTQKDNCILDNEKRLIHLKEIQARQSLAYKIPLGINCYVLSTKMFKVFLFNQPIVAHDLIQQIDKKFIISLVRFPTSIGTFHNIWKCMICIFVRRQRSVVFSYSKQLHESVRHSATTNQLRNLRDRV